MSDMSHLRIHIAPLGFEIDRIVLPAIKWKADKVCLLIHNEPTLKIQKPYIEKIKKQLKKNHIEIKIFTIDRLDLSTLIKRINEIISESQKNTFYVNVSSGSKIQAIACMMACMMFNEDCNLIPFYVEPEEYYPFEGDQQSYGLKRTIDLPLFQIQKPESKLIQALNIIKENDGKITKKDLAKKADEQKLIEIKKDSENYNQARYASLAANIIQPLLNKWKFVNIDKIGKNHWVRINQEGRYVTEFLN